MTPPPLLLRTEDGRQRQFDPQVLVVLDNVEISARSSHRTADQHKLELPELNSIGVPIGFHPAVLHQTLLALADSLAGAWGTVSLPTLVHCTPPASVSRRHNSRPTSLFVSAATRIPRTYKRFSGLFAHAMSQGFAAVSSHAGAETHEAEAEAATVAPRRSLHGARAEAAPTVGSEPEQTEKDGLVVRVRTTLSEVLSAAADAGLPIVRIANYVDEAACVGADAAAAVMAQRCTSLDAAHTLITGVRRGLTKAGPEPARTASIGVPISTIVNGARDGMGGRGRIVGVVVLPLSTPTDLAQHMRTVDGVSTVLSAPRSEYRSVVDVMHHAAVAPYDVPPYVAAARVAHALAIGPFRAEELGTE